MVSNPIDDARSIRLPVPYYCQGDKQNLCWAACCRMILAAAGQSVPFCTIVSQGLNGDCCQFADVPTCDQSNWPTELYAHYGMQPLWTAEAFSFGNVRYEIDERRPVNAILDYVTALHAVLIIGYYFNGDVLVNDPRRGQSRISYDYLQSAYGLGSVYGVYYNLARAA